MIPGSGGESKARWTKAELASPDWFLAGFDAERELFQFARVSRQTYHESSFLDHRIEPMPEQVITVAGADVDAVLQEFQPPPAAYIFHTAFCGSTLLASCLDHPAHTLVLREPMVLTHLGRRVRDTRSGGTSGLHRLVNRVAGLLDRSYPPERVLIKPSNFANSLVSGLLDGAVPGAGSRKCVALSNGLRNLLVSILKKPDEARNLMPIFLRSLLQDSDYARRVDLPPLDSLDLLQQSVVFWHCQRHYFQDVLRVREDRRVLPVSMESFLQEPLQNLVTINGFLGLGLDPDLIAGAVASGAFRRHSKAGTVYGPDQQKREADAVAKRHGAEIERVLAWARPMLRRLPVEPFSGLEETSA